ncbi:MAG: glycosyltransferase [Bacteroidetes bacterium]|nr:glycosyltransferase [Bacteroidota bacterium]
MNITFLNTFESSGGAGIAGKRLANALEINDQPVHNVVVYPGIQKQENVYAYANNRIGKSMAWIKLAIEKGMFYFHEKSPEIRFQFSTNRTGFNVSRLPVIKTADIIHLHWFHQGLLSLNDFNQLIQLQKPVVWTLHDMWAFTGGCHYAGRCNRFTNECGHCPYLKKPHNNDLSYSIHSKKAQIYKKANINIVTCSKWLANKAKESALLADMPITNIPNPIDTEKFKPENKSKVRKELGIPINKKIILFGAAKLNEGRKGFKYLLHALKRLASQQPEIVDKIALLVFGATDKELSRLLPFQLISLGSISNPEEAYNASDVFVLPSLEDNLPNTLMEAMSCGIPCVGFNAGGIPEMIDHKTNGYVSDYKSDEDLLNGISWIINNTEYERLTENARKKVVENYAEKIVASQYIELYNNLINIE